MKYAANILTLFRVVLSFLLVPLRDHCAVFTVIYLLCGLTDILDGVIARKTGTQSTLGARLDSAADLVLFAVILTLGVLWAGNRLTILLPPIIVVIVLRLLNLVISGVRHKKLLFIHTVANKATGVILFIAALAFMFTHSSVIVWVVCAVAALSSIEEGLVLLTDNHPDLNRKSIFIRNRQ
ncbi:CDP-alcohol phosphatidyltransferase family protein [Acetanaerobacterium elongatum]|uniref:CDP-diacylglycerol--glycerol-3-phosphate 3-phosphatidyltransferase n=1 Tax=Acetanaerobacterium elongatum TaxID=258515 RepID=A0A1G9W8G1_9FIRM|nr:CDP-alcohol phosphatidyltransferase family protein [Acetanaerobacterium elongatum]SDM80818.1 CDP-diacylglycerol--glycerol-3-phosphate 3-phosphatidyltransferase [Acetanaerobacterium elongatum]